MYKAGKEIKKFLHKIDLVIEVLDARIPFSSENPMLRKLRGHKPCVKILNKSDLADPKITSQWQAWLDKEKNIKTLSVDIKQHHKTHQIPALCRKLIPEKKDSSNGIRAMIMGIPNVGKSTLINSLAKRTIAKTGNEPAITKALQRIEIGHNIILFDTPGMLWPKIKNRNSGYRLAATGAIRDTAIEHCDIAFFAADYLLEAYPEKLKSRYKLESLPETELELLDSIGKRHGCLRTGGEVDLDKVSKLFLRDLQQGSLAEISFETPKTIDEEIKELTLILQQRQQVAQQKRSKR